MAPDRESEVGPRRLARAEAVLQGRTRQWCVVLEDAHDRHNVSAVLRTCDAFGIQDVHLVTENESLAELNPKVTMGAHRWLTLHQHAGADRAIEALRGAGYRLFVSHLDAAATPLPHLPGDVRAAYVFGNEQSGVTTRWVEAADATFVIPTSGFSGSLNLSVAVALTMYDRVLGRRGADLPPGNLAADELQALRATWYARLAGPTSERQREYAAFLERPLAPLHELGADRRHANVPRREPDPGRHSTPSHRPRALQRRPEHP